MTVRKIKSIGDIPYPIDVGADALSPLLTAGAALGITGEATDSAAWLQRVSTSDGPTTVKSIHGRTLRWNQLVSVATASVTNTEHGNHVDQYMQYTNPVAIIAGHIYLGKAKFTLLGDATSAVVYLTGTSSQGFVASNTTSPQGHIFTASASLNATLDFRVGAASYPATFGATVENLMLFDLTQMFGAGSEPSTVAEFEALYSLPYYEYDAGSLLPVNMTGIATDGFNQWDEQWEAGVISAADGTNIASTTTIRSKNHIPVFPNTEYCISIKNNTANYVVVAYDANKAYITYLKWGGAQGQKQTFTTPANCRYIRFDVNNTGSGAYGETYKHDICINISDPTRNGTYEPYWTAQRPIPAGILRAAGTAYDELTETERIERINAITIDATNGTSGITVANTGNENLKAFIFDNAAWNRMTSNAPRTSVASNTAVICDKLPTGGGYNGWTTPHIQLWPDNSADIIFAVAEGVSTVADLNTWLASNPLTIYYAMRDADFVTTTYDPPLNMSYRTEHGGTERVMAPTGELSAPPTIVAAQGYTAESLRDAALSAIAPVENGLASTNYGVGSYLVHGGQLCRVTTAIATGEAISIGTNVTATTVMAEVIALIAQ